jgi:hypothetical protein
MKHTLEQRVKLVTAEGKRHAILLHSMLLDYLGCFLSNDYLDCQWMARVLTVCFLLFSLSQKY